MAVALRYIFNRSEKVRDWVSAMLGTEKIGNDMYAAIGFVEDEELVAGAIYHDFKGHSVEISFAATTPKWCSLKSGRVVLNYPFEQLGVERLQAITAKSNKAARSFLERAGFVYEGKARRGFNGKEDAMIYSMLKEEAEKWAVPQYRHPHHLIPMQ
ncbi:MAG: GNAT family protein [Nitrosomonadaceae bacterium]